VIFEGSQERLEKMVQILLNGEPFDIVDNCSVARLLECCELTGQRLAVEINQHIIPRSQFEQYLLQLNDKVEIVRAIGGG
jgi:sulfur carrier protein